MRASLSCESRACLLFMHLPWPRGLFGLCYLFCHSFLTSYGVDELLGLRSLYLAFSLGWVLLGHRSFLLQSSLCLLCGLADTSTMPSHCLCHVAFWFMLTGPPLGLSRTFPFTQWSCSPVLLLGLFSYFLGLSWPILFLLASLAHLIPLAILGPF